MREVERYNPGAVEVEGFSQRVSQGFATIAPGLYVRAGIEEDTEELMSKLVEYAEAQRLDTMELADLKRGLARAAARKHELMSQIATGQELIDAVVLELRRRSISMDNIARLLGVSRQYVTRRYGDAPKGEVA